VNDLLTNNKAQSAFDASVGAAVFNKKFYVGVSATHLTAADLAELNYKMARHIYFMGGYNHDISSDITLRTNLLVKSDLHASPAMDLNVNALWKNMLWGGLSYRFGDAIAPMAGFQKIFNPIVSGRTTYEHVFRIGYSYDMTTSSIKDYSQGSHEIMVSYCFNITREPPKTISVNPRFL
jgi:type IX secretion system PorP/SprF family membrane protein